MSYSDEDDVCEELHSFIEDKVVSTRFSLFMGDTLRPFLSLHSPR